MLMEPIAAHGCGRNEADRLVILAQHPIGLAVVPRRHAERFRPTVGIALSLDADEHRRGGVLVPQRIAEGRCREMVADHQGVRAQRRVNRLTPVLFLIEGHLRGRIQISIKQ
jgi:hypothetical protein